MNSLSSESFRKASFKLLGLNGYLALIRRLFFIAFNSGYLKHDPVYSWHYFVPQILRCEDIVIDIGANLGYYSTIFSKAVRQKGKVYCVEPVAPIYRQLKRHLSHLDNVCLIPYALGRQNVDDAVISVPDNLRHLGYLRHGCLSLQEDEPNIHSKYSFPVKVRKGSNLFSNIGQIDYIKCDIEGHELTVFEDMEDLLIQHQPMIQIEIAGVNFNRITRLFCRIGYKGYKLIDGKLTDIDDLSLKDKLRFDTLFVSARYFYRIIPYLDRASVYDEKPAFNRLKAIKQASLESNPNLSS